MLGWLKKHQQKINPLLIFIACFFLINTVLFWISGSPYLHSIIRSETLTRNFIANYSTNAGTALIITYSIVNYLCYMMFLASIPAAFSAALAILLPYKYIIIPTTIITSTIVLAVLVFDVNTYLLFKFHLNAALIHLMFNHDWQDMLDPSRSELFQLILIAGSIPLIEITSAVITWRIIIFTKCTKLIKVILLSWACGSALSYVTLMLSIGHNNNLFIKQASNLPLYMQLIAKITPLANSEHILHGLSEHHYEQAIFSNTKLNYPKHQMECTIPRNSMNIIVIMVDALRADSMLHMPNIRKFASQSWYFSNHISGGNSTQAGIFSLFYSIPSNYWTAVLQQKRMPVLMMLMRKYKYTMHAFWSASMQAPPIDRAIFRKFNTLTLHGSDGLDIADRDQATTSNVQKFLINHAKSSHPFFLHILYDAPHAFCSPQRFPKPHLPDEPNCSRLPFLITHNRNTLFNNYLNAVHFSDQEINKVLNTIKEQGLLHNSIVIISSDHGQEFDDTHHGYWGHGSNYSTFQTKVPLIIHWPHQNSKIIKHQTSGYDLIPTLLDRLFSCKNPHQDYSIGYDLFQTSGRMPFILAGSYVTMGLIEPDRLTTMHASGAIDITTQLGEPLLNTSARPAVYKLALQLMRKYFY